MPAFGGAGRDRTGDLLNANQALSQLSYSPFFLWLVASCWWLVRTLEPATSNQPPATIFLLEADWMLPDGARPNRQNNIRELSSGDPRRLWTGKAAAYLIRQLQPLSLLERR
jgi:hypothetical protein